MRRLALAFIFLLGTARYGLSQAPCTFTINADRATLAAKIADSGTHSGDVICLNATSGQEPYATSLDVTAGGTKALEIRGAGSFQSQGSAGSTKLYSVTNGVFGLDMVASDSMHSPTISNIAFYQDVSSNNNAQDISIAANAGQAGLPIIMHHNDFIWTGTCNGYGIVTSIHNGLIYRNVFRTEVLSQCGYTNTTMEAIDVSVSDDGSLWQSASTMGSADSGGTNNVYVENNQFYGFTISADLQQSARVVWRFNQMFNASMADHGYDSGGQGERHIEYYNNAFKCGNYTNHGIELSGYIAKRGGTGMIFSNTFDAFDTTWCSTNNMNPNKPDVRFDQYTARVCSGGAVQPGSYPDNYPLSHQTGWGWIMGQNRLAGATAGNGGMYSPLNESGAPGTFYAPTIPNGFDQALEPHYLFNNTNSAFQELYVETGYVGDCRAMSWSTQSKTSDIHTVVSPPSASAGYAIPYANAGMELLAVFSDRIGGTAPTIASSPSCSWSALTGGTNSGLRLSAWHCTVTTGGPQTITVTHDSSTAARAFTVATLRGLTASPLDKNPAVHNDTAATTFNGTASGTLSTSTQIVLGYYALAAPLGDNINEGSGWNKAYAYSLVQGMTSFNGTTGGSDAFVGIVYKAVDANTTIQPQLTDGTSRDGISGTVTFKVNGNTTPGTASPLDNQVTDYLQANREYYLEAAMFDGTVGTGSGVRASRPATCTTGVAYWSTDQGSWNTSGSGGQGVLDKCTATNTWTDAWYVPYDYPNPLATVTGGSCTPDHLAFIQQPSDAVLGIVISPSPTIGVYDSGNVLCTDDLGSSVILTVNSGSCLTLGGTTTLPTEVSGIYTASNLTVATGVGSCTIKASAGMLTDAVSSSFTISAAPAAGSGGGLKLKLRLKGFVN